MTLLLRFWRNSTQHKCGFASLRQPPFSPLLFFFLRLGKLIFVPLLFERESFYSSVQIALLLPVITLQCPATQINGLLSREQERGGPMVDRRQRHVFIPTAETNSGHQSGSLQNICQPLVSTTTTWEYNWTQLSISVSDSESEQTICTL